MPVLCGRGSASDGVVIRYVLPVLWTVDDIEFPHNGLYAASCVSIPKR